MKEIGGLLMNKKSHNVIDYDQFLAKWTKDIPESEIRRLLKFQGEYYFAGGKPGSLPINDFIQIIQDIIDAQKEKWNSNDKKQRFDVLEDYNYGETGGKPYLKEVLANRFKEKEDLQVDPNDIVITSGSQQALYAILDTSINPGDFIVTPRPAYLGFLGPAAKMNANIVTVATDLDGMIPEELEECMEQCSKQFHKVPKIIYLVAYSDNPKGTTLPEKRKKEIYEIAAKYNCLLIDDEAYKYIQYKDSKVKPLINYDDDRNRVAYLSTTSKEAAVFRLGYSIFPKPLQEQVLKSKGYLDLCTPTIVQKIAAEYYKNYIDAALEKTLSDYEKRRDAMIEAIEEYFPEGKFTRPTGGFFVWWESNKKDFDSANFMEKYVMKEDIIYVPGAAFYPVRGYAYEDNMIKDNIIRHDGMRLGFSFKAEDVISEGMKKLGLILQKHL